MCIRDSTGSGLAGRTIVLDPGHGGSDPGGCVDGAPINDAEVGYAVAVRLRSLLEPVSYTHLADLVVLSDSPLKVDPMAIKDIKVLETIKDGETVYTA